MTGRLLPLFLCGATAGGCSVLLFFLRRTLEGDGTPRRFRFLYRQKRRKTKRRRRVALGFLTDFLFCFLFGAYLVLYDATVLGGRGRIFHAVAFFCGVFLVRRVFLFLLFRPAERAVGFCLDLVRFLLRCLTYPARKCFSLLFAFLSSVYLILKAKNDKIRLQRRAKREITAIETDAGRAFLPVAVTESLISGRE